MSSESPGDYGLPGDWVGSSAYSPEYGQCCSDRIAAVLGAVLPTITSQLARIAQALEDKLGKPCEKLEECMDEIEKEIRKRFEAPTASCDECKRMAEQGLGGTIEYAVRCAGACLEETEKICSLGEPSTWGKPCDTCGSECCECVEGVCSPVDCPEEEPDKPKRKFVGYCNPLTGSIAVAKQGEAPPGEGFVPVALSDDEQAAAIEASKNCSKQSQFPTFNPIIQPTSSGGILCDLNKYATGTALGSLLTGSSAVNMADAFRQLTRGVLGVGFEGLNPGQLGEVIYGAIRTLTGLPPYMSSQLLPTIAGALGCNDPQWQEGIRTLGQITSITNYIGADVGEFTTQLRYALNAGCRQKFLDPDKAMAAFLADSMDARQLDTHFAVHGLCPAAVTQYTRAARSKPIPLQLAMMRRRKAINSNQYAEGMRQLGYLETSTSEQLYNLTEQIPTLTDITRLMVRDADDEALAARLGLDSYFTEKYGRQLREWSEAQGVPEKFARYYWRAHWNIPSPGQLFTFYHRLRDNPQFGGRDKVLDDIKAALIQQDILPYWHEHYLATSFHPIGRIDIRRAFNIGALKEEELAPAYRQLGYSDETSDLLADFTKRLRIASLPNHRAIKLWIRGTITAAEVKERLAADGIPVHDIDRAMQDSEAQFASGPIAAAYVKAYLSRDTFISLLTERGVTQAGASNIADVLALKRIDALPIKDYIAGAIDREEVEAAMQADGLNSNIANHLLEAADRSIENAFIVSCQRGIKRRYLLGELDTEEAQAELTNRGTTLARANKLIDWWSCERSATSKAISASKLCHWLSLGAITSTDFDRRLRRLGYSDADAALMVEDCLTGISVKRLADAKKEAKQHVAESERAARALRRAEAAAARLAASQAQAATKARQTRMNRERQLLSASQKLAAKCECDLLEALNKAKDAYSRIQREFGLSPDETLQVMLSAVEEWQGTDIDDIDTIFNAFAQQAAGVESADAGQ